MLTGAVALEIRVFHNDVDQLLQIRLDQRVELVKFLLSIFRTL